MAKSSPVLVVLHGTKRAAREHPWSTIVNTASYGPLFGNCVIRSMDMVVKGGAPTSTGILYKGVRLGWVKVLVC